MELFILNSSYKPSTTVHRYETLVWTERYSNAGDFKLETENDISILSVLPVGSLISHTDTKEVMIVENHEIKRDNNKKLVTTVSGRSFETFAENRVTIGSNQPLKNNVAGDPTDDIVYTTSPMTAPDLIQTLLRAGLESGYASADDSIPNLVVTQSVRIPDAAMAHTVKRGDVYSKVLEYAKLFRGGIRTLRPIGVDTTIDILIHDGLDKQNTVIFYGLYEDLEDANYFWSIQDHKNYVQIATEIDSRLYRHRDLGSALTGLNRRTLYVEASDVKGLFPVPAANDIVSSRAQTNLDEHPQIFLLQAQISKTAKPKFKINYDIGDLVTVFTEFSSGQTMRVTEHILTVDKNGAVGYPSLSAI